MRRRIAVLFAAVLFISTCVSAQTHSRYIRVFVALADNEHQGIVPVPAALGNGEDAARNLYWGAAFGVRTFFKNSSEWKETLHSEKPDASIAERSVFTNRDHDVVLIAEAYRGSEIKRTLSVFFRAAARIEYFSILPDDEAVAFANADPQRMPDLVVYVGHDGLMDFPLQVDFTGRAKKGAPAIILACASKQYFRDNLRAAAATPLLWTTGLMAPEAYTLKAALDGWMADESKEQIRKRAADAYAKYQKVSEAAALRLFSSDW
jgi:hypothetical protein